MHPENPPGAWYVVSPGETLDQIAVRAGVPPEDILEVNGLARASDVQPGRIIYVLSGPASSPTAAPGAVAASGTPSGIAPSASSSMWPPPSGDHPLPPLSTITLTPGAARFRWPLEATAIGSPYGTRQGRLHEGIDLPAPIGTPVFAAGDGQVIYAGDGIRGYGNLIVLQHEGDLLTVYAHNSQLLVGQGDKVTAGQRIALVGQSGRATGPHLHFEVRSGQIPQDPVSYLPSRTGGPP
jgi:murein DD-endopeptidase MepM/ murein hydrolase activator NlpD